MATDKYTKYIGDENSIKWAQASRYIYLNKILKINKLIHAIDIGDFNLSKFLVLEYKYNVDVKDNHIPAIFLSLSKNVEIFKLLLLNNANLCPKIDGDTILIKIVRKNDLELLEFVLEHRRADIDIDFQDANGNTAFMIACKNNFTEIAEILIENGAEIDIKNKDKNTALMISCEKGYIEITNMLLERANLTCVNNIGDTALHRASRFQNIEIIQLLMKAMSIETIQHKNIFDKTALEVWNIIEININPEIEKLDIFKDLLKREN